MRVHVSSFVRVHVLCLVHVPSDKSETRENRETDREGRESDDRRGQRGRGEKGEERKMSEKERVLKTNGKGEC